MKYAPHPNPSLQGTLPDPITGFLFRSESFKQIAQLSSQADAECPVALLWIDLDHFKQINESFGHHCGDAVIAEIALRLRNKSNERATWCRMGGDEFICIAPNSDLQHARQMAEVLLRAVEIPLPIGDLLLSLTASIGIAILDSNQESPTAFLERADRAMNAAKQAGGGRIVVSGDEPVPGKLGIHLTPAELALENKLHNALENGGLTLHFQPIVELDGRVDSVEALMRCEFDGNNIPPATFLPIADKTGLIVRLGEWSLLACASLTYRLNCAGHQIKVAINVSSAQLSATNFSQALHTALVCSRVSPEHIELELSESLFMDTSVIIQENLRAIRAAGVGLVIDDFGIGYLHLENLKTIAATKIKLDRAFVTVLPHDRRAFAAVQALTALGKELGIEVIAKGVENQAQQDALRAAGILRCQGYLHAPPMSETELLEWLQPGWTS